MDETRTALFFFATGALLLWTALRKFRTVRRIEDTARSKAASAPQGHVELQGIAWPENDAVFLSSSGAEVVYYSLNVERQQKQGTGKSRKAWRSVFRHEHAPAFLLADATGLVRIDPSGAELNLDSTRTRTWGSLPQADRQRVLEYTADKEVSGFPPSEFLFGLFASRFRIVESEIQVGSPLYAHGDFRTTESAREYFRAGGLTRFHAGVFDPAQREQKRLDGLLDVDGDGAVSAKEAAAGLCRAAAAARDEARTANSQESDFPVHGRLATSKQHKLFLANRHEEHLVQGTARTVYLPMAGGILSLSAAVFVLTGGFSSTTPKSVPSLPNIAVAPKAGAAPATAAAAKAAAAPRPEPAGSALRDECAGGKATACGELVARAGELRISDGERRNYAARACALGLSQHCP